MALGYEGYGVVNGTICLATGSGLSRSRNRLDSSSGYGGSDYGWPHTYDYDNLDGSLNFEAHPAVLSTIYGLLGSKTSSSSLAAYPTYGTSFVISEGWWNSLNISASDGAAVQGSVSVVGNISDYNPSGFSGEYISNRTGYDAGHRVIDEIPPLNPSASNLYPIPFWKTNVNGYDAMSWNVTWNQDVSKIFACGETENPTEPYIIGIGPTTGTFAIEAAVVDASASFADSQGFSVSIAGSSGFSITGELNSIGHDIQTGAGIVLVSAEYQIYS